MTASSATIDLMAYNFNLETTDFLSQFRRPPPQTLVGQSFLHELAREGDVMTAEVILSAGGEIDLPDAHGRRPLHEAAAANRTEMMDFLIENGALLDAPIHPFGHTALYLAVERGNAEAARRLIESGARLTVADGISGQGLLHMAAAKGDTRLAGILIAAGIDVFTEDKKGQTARDYAARHNNADLEKTLLKVMEHHARC